MVGLGREVHVAPPDHDEVAHYPGVHQGRNQDLKIVRQNGRLVCFPQKGWGLGSGLCPIPELDFFEMFVLILCILEAFRCRMLGNSYVFIFAICRFWSNSLEHSANFKCIENILSFKINLKTHFIFYRIATHACKQYDRCATFGHF